MLDANAVKGLPIGVDWAIGVATQQHKLVSDRVLKRDIFDRLRQATASQPELLAELCREYVREARLTIAQLRTALAANDAAKVRDRAHYLKGSSMTLGAQELWQVCATLEVMGRDANLSAAEPTLDKVLAALRDVEIELGQVVGPSALPAEGSAA